MQVPQIQQQGNRLMVQGDLTVETVGALLSTGLPELSGEVEISLEQVSDVDSSAISLLLQWLREAKIRNISINYCHLPAPLVSLAALYGVIDMLPQRLVHNH